MTQPVRLHGIVTEDGRLTVDLPSEIPAGPVEVVIRPVERLPAEPRPCPLTPQAARAKLAAAGVLSTTPYAPNGAVPLTIEEREALGQVFAHPRTFSMLIDEDRGVY